MKGGPTKRANEIVGLSGEPLQQAYRNCGFDDDVINTADEKAVRNAVIEETVGPGCFRDGALKCFQLYQGSRRASYNFTVTGGGTPRNTLSKGT